MERNKQHRNRQILTGASGLIGSHHLGRNQRGNRLIPLYREDGFDLLDRDSVFRIVESHSEQADSLVHLASFTDVSSAHLQTGDVNGSCYQINVVGNQNIIDACNEFGLHFVYISTDFVFSGELPTSLHEESPCNPIEWYGMTKSIAESSTRSTANDWTILRIAYPYFDRPGIRTDLVTFIRNTLAKGNPVRLFTDQIITPTHADDISNALSLIAHEKPAGETFHVVGNESLSPWLLGKQVADIFDLDADLVEESSLEEYLKTDPRPRQKHLKICNQKYRNFCINHSAAPPHSIEEALSAACPVPA